MSSVFPAGSLSYESDRSSTGDRSGSVDDEQSRQRTTRRAVLTGAGIGASALAGCNTLGGGSADPFADGDWRSYGNGPTNANRVDGGAPAPAESDQLLPEDWPYAPPVVHDGVVYLATGRRVAALSTDGSERWSVDLDGETSGAPALDPDRGRLYVPTMSVPSSDAAGPNPAGVTAFALGDGSVVATYQVGERRTYGATVADGDLYARSASACVRLAPDGTERWRRPLDPLVYDEYNLGDGTATQVPPAVDGDLVAVPDRDALVALDRADGTERWRVSVDTPYAATVFDDDGLVQTGWQGTVAVDRSGRVRWRRDLHSRAAAAAADGDLYVVAGDLHELDAESGETNWQAHLPSEGTAAPVVTDEAVVAATDGVRAFERTSGLFSDRLRWRDSSVRATAYASPVVAAGRVFVVGSFGFVALRSDEK